MTIARRELLAMIGASALGACKRAPDERVIPYVNAPADVVPGRPRFYATALETDGYAIGVLAESHEGRPTKIEGNPDHPASLGATSALEQSAVLALYDPDRSQSVTKDGTPTTWRAMRDAMARAARDSRDGTGVFVVIEPTASPTIAARVAALRARYPKIDLRWHAPLAPRSAWDGASIAFGAPYETRLDVAAADVILALDSDFLAAGPASLVHARAFASRRKPEKSSDAMNRLYAIEPTPSGTGLAADHRLRTKGRDVIAVAARIAIELAANGVSLPSVLLHSLAPHADRSAKANDPWARAVAKDLAAHRGASLVVAGEAQPPAVHALAHAMNVALGNMGPVVKLAPSPIVDAGTDAFDLRPLARALDAGAVNALVVLGANPVYDAPADLGLAEKISRSRDRFHLGAHANETALLCAWHAPKAHPLETWGDARAFDGTATIVQPIRTASAEVRTIVDAIDALLDAPPSAMHDAVHDTWTRARGDAAQSFAAWIERGVIPDTAIAPIDPAPPLRADAIANAIAKLAPPKDPGALEITLHRDAKVHDGSRANEKWLQELPDRVTSLTWDNAARIGRVTAARLGIRSGDVVKLDVAGRIIRAAALITPDQADDAIAIALGYGRQGAESVARDVGANAYRLRTTDAPWFADVVITKTGQEQTLALMQPVQSLEGRDDEIALHRTKDEWERAPKFAEEANKRRLTLYELAPTAARQWGMVVDLSACTGCGSCVVACMAENNVPTVGKTGVAKGRAMHWLRIDRYYIGPLEDADAVLQPMACQQCERAPCEYVCPVNATTHSADGLNQMVYNRCVGTRFCSNNCPYKVRRFNWYDYHDDEAASVALVHNPDVTVRARGVMEKCTYCVQRIREAEIDEKVQGTRIHDGTIQTACEQACASGAIIFGDINESGSRVAKLRGSERAFGALTSTGAEPRTRYLAKIRNPNPELA